MTSSNLARECGACVGSDDPSTRLREDGTVRCNDCWTLDCETKELHAGDEARPSVCNAPSGFDVKCTLPKDHGDVHSWSRPSETKKPDTWDSENRRSVAARYRVARGLPDKTKQRASEACVACSVDPRQCPKHAPRLNEAPLGRWRVGTKLGRTLYLDDAVVGMVDSRELAASIVDAMNRTALPDEKQGQAWPSPRLARDYALEECALLLDSCEGQHRHMSPMPVDDKNVLLADEYQRLARVIRSKITPQCADKPRPEEPR